MFNNNLLVHDSHNCTLNFIINLKDKNIGLLS